MIDNFEDRPVLDRQMADLLVEPVEPRGVGLVVCAHHMCVSMWGANEVKARMRTTALVGTFEGNPKTRSEFFDAIPGPIRQCP